MNTLKHSILFAFLTLILTGSLIHIGACPASAEVKIATVDVNRILNEMSDSKLKKKEIDERTTQAKKKLEERKKELLAMEKKLKDGKFSDDSKEAEAFRVEARNFTRYVKDTEEDLKKEFLKINKDLTDKVVLRIKKFAESKGLDLVLDRSETVRGPVLFGNRSADITDAIIKEMNG